MCSTANPGIRSCFRVSLLATYFEAESRAWSVRSPLSHFMFRFLRFDTSSVFCYTDSRIVSSLIYLMCL